MSLKSCVKNDDFPFYLAVTINWSSKISNLDTQIEDYLLTHCLHQKIKIIVLLLYIPMRWQFYDKTTRLFLLSMYEASGRFKKPWLSMKKYEGESYIFICWPWTPDSIQYLCPLCILPMINWYRFKTNKYIQGLNWI